MIWRTRIGRQRAAFSLVEIAIATLKAAPADGATLLVTPMSMLGIYPHTYKKLPYDPGKDFVAVTMVCGIPFMLVVHPSLPVNTVAQLVALAKGSRPKLI